MSFLMSVSTTPAEVLQKIKAMDRIVKEAPPAGEQYTWESLMRHLHHFGVLVTIPVKEKKPAKYTPPLSLEFLSTNPQIPPTQVLPPPFPVQPDETVEQRLGHSMEDWFSCLKEITLAFHLCISRQKYFVQQATALKDVPDKKTEYREMLSKAEKLLRAGAKCQNMVQGMINVDYMSQLSKLVDEDFYELPPPPSSEKKEK